MEWVLAVIAVAVIGAAAAVATGAWGQMREEPIRDTYRQELPSGTLSGAEVHDLRFAVSLRGYSMGQVDAVIDRLSAEITERDRQLELLRDQAARSGPGRPTPDLSERRTGPAVMRSGAASDPAHGENGLTDR